MSENVYVAYVNQYYIKLFYEEMELIKAIEFLSTNPRDLKVYERQPPIIISYLPFSHLYEDMVMFLSKEYYVVHVSTFRKKDGSWRKTSHSVVYPTITDEENIIKRIRDFNYKEISDYSYLKFVKR